MSTKKISKKRKKKTLRLPAGAGPLSALERGGDIAGEHRRSVIRVTLQALDELVERTGAPVAPRLLVNYLRGNEAPPGPRDDANRDDANRDGAPRDDAPRRFRSKVQGLFWAMSAAFVTELVEVQCMEAYIDEAGEKGRALVLSSFGRRVLEDNESPESADLAIVGLVPQRPALGANPEVEERLRELRRRIAREEGRPPFSVFSNATLAYIADCRPESTADLAETPGLGVERLRKYARRILNVLRKA